MDILIQAPSDSSGSLVRLLKSIVNADYFGVRRPHLTIELPTKIDPPTWRYLENLIWPPLDWSGAPHASQVSLRHRIPRRTATERDASARLVESFYPVRTGNSHLLLLSPQVELSPLYYHYVIYNLLEYKYSAHGAAVTDFPNLVGFSLELPSHHLNGTEPLKPPLMERTPPKDKDKGLPGARTPFLWQAPNANAALYFGDKWIEFHSFLSARLTKPPSARRKVFSRKHPAWLESLLELIRARGYYMLYPNFPKDDDAIATIHDELYQVPEEYLDPPEKQSSPAANLNVDEPLTADEEKNSRSSPPNDEHQLLESSLISLLPNNGDLLDVSNLPLLSYNGINISRKLSHKAAMSFAETFRSEIGTCRTTSETTPRTANSAFDLFCHLDEIYDPMKLPVRQYGPPQILGAAHEYDEDMIPAEHHANAKQESSAHLARQGGQPAPLRPAPAPKPDLPQQDDSAETQTEFQKQMQRQAKQVGVPSVVGPAEPEAMEEAPAAPIVAPASSESSVQPAETPQPTHDGFRLQPPPKVVENPAAEVGQDRGAGW